MTLREENEALKAQLARVRDALCPTSLGTDMATWRAIIQRQKEHVFNEYRLTQLLGRANGQVVMIIFQRYTDAVGEILDGKEEG